MKMTIMACALLGLMSLAKSETLTASQFMVAEDMTEKKPVTHNLHLQAPNGQQGRVIVLGPADAHYDVRVTIHLKDDPRQAESCNFSFARTPKAMIPTCLLDFSEPHLTKKIDLNASKKTIDPPTLKE